MHGDDPVSFGFDIDGKLAVVKVTREAIESCLSVPSDGNYDQVLRKNEIEISSALTSWLATDKPIDLDVDRGALTKIMDKYNAH